MSCILFFSFILGIPLGIVFFVAAMIFIHATKNQLVRKNHVFFVQQAILGTRVILFLSFLCGVGFGILENEQEIVSLFAFAR